ncbi:unnamed protein product [Prorocentrum cordatum]|uniref:subtilisin n=1 Tax=Prorocentrum cordatum TaxID=2364126 RepID=A0ABN9RF98_9DINO|nr:unnamed protein product [Polarella glacialis]
MARCVVIASLIGASGAAGFASAGDLQLMQISKTAQTMSRDERGREFYTHANVRVYPSAADPPRRDQAPIRKWIFALNSSATDQVLETFIAEPEFQGSGRHTQPDMGALAFAFGDLTEDGLQAVLERNSESVKYAEEDELHNYIFDAADEEVGVYDEDIVMGGVASASATCNHPWGISAINADVGRPRGSGVSIFSLDTGVRSTHADFEGRAVRYLDLTNPENTLTVCDGTDTTCANDLNGHGTHVAGTSIGHCYGVASAATLYAAKVLKDDGTGYLSWIVDAIEYIETNVPMPFVISVSIEGPGTHQSVEDAMDQVVNSGATVVVAAGNSNTDACTVTPAFVPSAITVASYDQSNAKSSFSNYGSCIDVWAPGSSVKSTSHSGDTATSTKSGTSMATPHVAGLVAIMYEDPGTTALTADQKKTLLLQGSATNTITGIPTAYGGTANVVAQAPSVTPAPTPAPVSGVGDPHLTNMYGEHFDLYRSGVNVLLQIPRWTGAEQTLLRLEADARRIGGACSDVYRRGRENIWALD